MTAMALERAERQIEVLELRLRALEEAVVAAGYRPHLINAPGRPPEWVLEPFHPGLLLEAALEAWREGEEAGQWS